ncbi:hypothetical protein [Empedobacter tilapiae]
MEIKEAFDVIKETKEDFKNVLLERLKLPIINYYIFFLIIYNWDIIVMLFFYKGNAEIRIEKVKSLYESYNFLFVLNWRMLVPLIYSFISCMIFPYVSSFIESKLKRTNEKRIEDFYDLEDNKAEREKKVIDKRSGNLEKSKLITEVDNLKLQLFESEKEVTKLLTNNNENNSFNEKKIKEYKDLTDDLKKHESDLISLLDSQRKFLYRVNIKFLKEKVLIFSEIKVDFSIINFYDFLVELCNCISQEYDNDKSLVDFSDITHSIVSVVDKFYNLNENDQFKLSVQILELFENFGLLKFQRISDREILVQIIDDFDNFDEYVIDEKTLLSLNGI